MFQLLRVFILMLIASNSYSKYILTPISMVYYSQLSSKGEIITNNPILQQELMTIKSNLISKNSLSDTDKLVIEAYSADILTKLDHMPNEKLTKTQISNLQTMYDKVSTISNTAVTPESFIVLGDIGTQIMTYKTLPNLIKQAKLNKGFYEKAIELDKTFFAAYVRLATWYYYAPRIGGGDLNISLDFLNKGEEFITQEFEKFQLYMWRSQIYFRQKLFEKSNEELQKAASIFPHHTWPKKMMELYSKGKYKE